MDTSSIFPLKKCTKCGNEYPATPPYFQKRKRGLYGVGSWCKWCRREYKRQDYHKDLSESRAKSKMRRDRQPETLKDAIKARSRNWYRENIERAKATRKLYYKTHQEQASNRSKKNHEKNKASDLKRAARWRSMHQVEMREYRRKWVAKYPERHRVSTHNRRARLRNAHGTHTVREIEQLYRTQRGKCWYCQCDLGTQYHADHRIPLSQGGSNDIANIVLACPECNWSKGAKLPQEWNGRLL